MDYFDELKPTKPAKKRKNPSGFLNLLTILMLIGTGLITALYVSIHANPHTAFNPFPPPVVPTPYLLPTVTPITPTEVIPPTLTLQPSLTPIPTETPTATSTPTAANTPFVIILPTLTSGPTVTVEVDEDSPYPFTVMPGSPATLSSSIMQPEVGCDWLGVGGNVVDLHGAPIVGLRVQLYGSLKGRVKAEMSISGTIKRYGEAGYEIMIDDTPVDSYRTLWVQLFSQAGGALSEKVFFNTVNSCEENLTIINFKQVRE